MVSKIVFFYYYYLEAVGGSGDGRYGGRYLCREGGMEIGIYVGR